MTLWNAPQWMVDRLLSLAPLGTITSGYYDRPYLYPALILCNSALVDPFNFNTWAMEPLGRPDGTEQSLKNSVEATLLVFVKVYKKNFISFARNHLTKVFTSYGCIRDTIPWYCTGCGRAFLSLLIERIIPSLLPYSGMSIVQLRAFLWSLVDWDAGQTPVSTHGFGCTCY